jgi:hypothetical protein
MEQWRADLDAHLRLKAMSGNTRPPERQKRRQKRLRRVARDFEAAMTPADREFLKDMRVSTDG